MISRLAALSAREEATHAPLATVLALLTAVAMALLHLAQTQGFYFPAGQFKNLHLGFALLLGTLSLLEATPRERRTQRAWLVLVCLLVLVPVVYIHLEYQDLLGLRSFRPRSADTAMALLLLGVALYLAGRLWGWTVPGLALAAILYGYYGNLLPGELFFHAGIRFQRLVGYTSIPYFQGLLGGLTELSAGTIFMFMLFAGVLRVTGGIDFIITVAYALGGRSRAGPGQVAVVASGLLAMISGSTVANVASTGAFTIPMMKRHGFSPAFAGAVEAVASTGGQLTPPVMGLAAFLIVGVTGIPYLEVMAAAALPALIYYLYLMVAVHLRAVRLGLQAQAAPPPEVAEQGGLGRAFLAYGHLLLGIVLLILLMVWRMPPGTAALYALLALLGLEALKRLLLHWREPLAALRSIALMVIQGLESGARAGAQVAIVIAVIAILIEFLSVTGFAQKLSLAMLDLAGGSLPLLLVIAAITCLAFGLGLPTSAAYILVALLGAPALTQLGVPLLAAHLFVFFFANVSALTPPVAIAALVAANVAGARFFPTALLGVRLGLPGFLLPFLFVARPDLLGLGASWWQQGWAALVALAGVVALAVAFEGELGGRLRHWQRVLLVVGATGLLVPGLVATLAGLALLAAVVVGRVVVPETAR